jgi:predicted MFS family arabinose efflux permease
MMNGAVASCEDVRQRDRGEGTENATMTPAATFRAGGGPRPRWGAVLAYAALGAANQMLWLTFTPITTGSARHYGVSVDAVGWLSELFPLLYVVLAIPSGLLLDRWFMRAFLAGAVIDGVGAVARVIGGSFSAVLVGQLLVAVAQPLVLGSITKVIDRSLPTSSRPRGIAIASAGLFAGMVLALGLGSVFGAGHLRSLLLIQAGIGIAATASVIATAPRSQAVVRGSVAGPFRTAWSDRSIRLLVAVAALGFGVFVALTTWLQALLDPAGVSAEAAGILLMAMVVAGAVSGAVLAPVAIVRDRAVTMLVVAVVTTVVGCVVLAVVPGFVAGLVVCVAIGASLLSALPVILTLVERLAGSAGATATGLVWLGGNGGGIVVALLVQVCVHRPWLAFLLMAAVIASALGLLGPLRSRLAAQLPAAPGATSTAAFTEGSTDV